MLSEDTFSNVYQPFGNITSVVLIDAIVTKSGQFLTCGVARFSSYLANALVGFTNPDGSNKIQLSFGANSYDFCLGIIQKNNGEIIALGDSNAE